MLLLQDPESCDDIGIILMSNNLHIFKGETKLLSHPASAVFCCVVSVLVVCVYELIFQSWCIKLQVTPKYASVVILVILAFGSFSNLRMNVNVWMI